MRDFLATNHLCLPATSTCHFGEQGTWLDLRGERLHCIDHVAIPEEWLHCATHSQVLEEFDLATSKDDHRLVAIQLQWNDLVEIVKFQKRARRVVQIDYKRADITDTIRNYQPASWTADIEQHTEEFNQHLHLAMQLGEQPNVSQIKKHYSDEEAWNTRKIKLKHRATLKALRTRIAHDLLRRCFDAWRAKNSDLFTEGTCYTTMLHCWNFKHWIAFRRAAQKLKQQLCHAKQCKLQCVLDDMNAETAASEILRHLRSFKGPTNPKKLKQKTLPLVHDAEGNVCVHPAEALGVWVDFFMQMEGGHRTSLPQLRAEWIEELSQFASAEINIDISEVPTLTDLEISYRRVPCGRAQGPDGIPGEVCHYQPASIAKASYSQLAKLVCHGQEFLWHKGGQLTPAYKGKGPTSSCTSYRSLLVSSNIRKALHRTIRQSSASLYENFLEAQQVGGRRKIPVQLALHQVRAHMRRAANQGRSAGVLFLDLTEAFYRIMREITIGGTPTDELLAHAMHRLNLPPSALHDIRALLNEPSLLQQAGLSVTAQRCIQSIHTGTFFWLAGQHDAAKTSMGTRPGDCFVDIVFGYAWGIVLKKMEAPMVEHDLVDKLPAADCPNFFGDKLPGIPCTPSDYVFIGPTWMDDLALCVEGGSPQQLESRMGSVASFLLDLCKQHMMTPNLARGKTELLMVFRGAGSRRFTTKHYGPETSMTFPVICDTGMHHIQIVKQYRHLGGWLHHKPDQRADIKQKSVLAHETFSRHRKVLFANQRLPIAKRAEMFSTLVLTKMLYGADSWTMSTTRDKERLHAAIMRLYKRLIRWKPDMNMCDEMIILQTGLPSPTELLRRARLRYLSVLLNCDMPLIWSLLNEDHEWKRLIEDDLNWMWMQLRHSSSLQDPKGHLGQWILIIQDHKTYWKRLVNRACSHAILQRRKEVEVCELHRRLFERAVQCFGFPELPNPLVAGTRGDEDVEMFGCLTCRIACGSKAGEGAHMFRKHNMVATCRQWYDEPSCPSCLKFFHTMAKMKAHLYYSKVCRHRLLSRNMRCQHMPGTGSDADRSREAATHDFLLPPLKGEGPQLPPAHPREEICIDDNLHLHLVEAIDARQTFSQIDDSLGEYIMTHPISWSTWRATLRFFVDMFGEEDADFFQYDLTEFKAFFEKYLRTAAWPFLHSKRHEDGMHQQRTIAVCHNQCKWFLKHTGDFAVNAPRTFGRHRYVLHAFSGRRRVGDLQYFLERAAGGTNHIFCTSSLSTLLSTRPGATSRMLRQGAFGWKPLGLDGS